MYIQIMNKKEFKIIKEQMLEISKRIMEIKSKIITEEATKQSLILPFFQVLKYNVFDPTEFVPEYTADFGIKKGEKVDYAILLEDKLSMLVEAKSCNIKLDKHAGQLSRYFNTANAKIGILTNGIEYRFFSDVELENRMDEEAFYILNMLEIKDADIEFLYLYLKSEFNVVKACEVASYLKDKSKIKNVINSELENPSDNFVNLIISSINEKRKTATLIAKYKPLVKSVLDEKIRELAIEKIENEIEDPTASARSASKIVTTEEEFVAYGIILGMLGDIIDTGNICYKDTENYLNILLLGNVRKWICRLYLNGQKQYIVFADSEKVFIEDIGELCNHKDKFINSLRIRVEEII